MAAKGAKKPPKKRGANNYKLPDPIPNGEILSDLSKKQWIIGKSVGVGGFGEIYSAASYKDIIPKEYPFVIKIEPHGNGPLFVEMHFYMRNAKPDDVDAWMKSKKLKTLGMPRYIASGSHECNGTKYRFVVMERYGTDLWKLFEQNNRKFPEHTVYKVAYQIINVLEYIHSRTYVHADIKGANLLLDLKSPNQVYLVDFGLASHYTTKPDFKPEPKKAHDGTIEYTSRDSHQGVLTMRGDLEILGYNIIQWLSGALPWETNLSSPVNVHKEKEKAMADVPSFLNKCFKGNVPDSVHKFIKLIVDLKFNEAPDYEKCRKIFIEGLKKLGHTPDGKLEFKTSINSNVQEITKKVRTPRKAAAVGIRKSPRAVNRLSSPGPGDNLLDSSTVGIVMDKKRGGIKDIQKVLDDIESDEEYDIKITKKKKIRKKVDNEIKPVVMKKSSELPPVKIKSRTIRNQNNVHTMSRRPRVPKIKIANDSSDDDMFAD